MGNIANIKIKPMQVLLGQNIAQVQTITCVADVAGASAGKYFLYHDVAKTKKYIWLKVGASVDPAPAGGWTGTMVTVTTGDSATTIAAAVATAMTATGFTASAANGVVTLTHTVMGYAPPARDSLIAPTGFAFAVTTKGNVEKDVGFTSGEIVVSGLAKTKDVITAHQTGKTELGDVVTGYGKPSLAFTLQETDKTSVQSYLINAGSTTYFPEGVGMVETVGYGPEGVGAPTPTLRVRLHPVASGAADKSQDYVFWQAALEIDKFNFAGDKFSDIPVKMPIYPDFTKPTSSQYFIVGDPVNV
jgi:hypothetical protein